MIQLLADQPWLIVCLLTAIVIVACVAIVFITDYLRTSQQAEIDAALKHDMLNRGMSAAEIKAVLEANTAGEEARLALKQRVRVGLGSFQVEVGDRQEAQPGTPPAHA